MNWKLIRVVDTYLGIPLLYLGTLVRSVFRKSPAAGNPGGYKRILVVKFWGIGNIFMLLPIVAALREKFAPEELDLLTLSSNRDAAESTDFFHRIYTIDTGNAFKFAETAISNLTTLSQKEYDLIIDFEQFARFSALFCALIGKHTTIGFNTSNQHRHALYTHSVLYDNTVHITRSFLSLAAFADRDGAIANQGLLQPPVPKPLRDTDIRRELGLGANEIVILMHIGTSGNFQERRWPTSSFMDLADRLVRAYHVTIVYTGLQDEIGLFENEQRPLQNNGRMRNFIGKLSFRQYYALVSASDLIVSADTAAIHMASFADVPAVGLYGPNTPLLYGPWGRNSLSLTKDLHCSPCITNFNAKIHTCRHPDGKGACMKQISVDEVYRTVTNTYLEQNAPCRLHHAAPRTPCAASSH